METMLRTMLLLLALLTATAQPPQVPPGWQNQPLHLPPGLQANFAPGLQELHSNEQNLPCTLYNVLVEFEDGTDESEWTCIVYGVDAWNAGSSGRYAGVTVEGMEHVLAQNPGIQSGRTTLHARGAMLSNHKLTVGSENALTFGEDTELPDDRRRRLSSSTGNLSVLVVRVSTSDAALTSTKAKLTGDVFGTTGSGDSINLKSQVEECSNSVATINPGVGTGSACVDDPDAIFAVNRPLIMVPLLTTATGSTVTNSIRLVICAFTMVPIHKRMTVRKWCLRVVSCIPNKILTSKCSLRFSANESASTRCCICGGGETINYDNNAVDGVMDLQLTINAVGRTRYELETAAVEELKSLFYVDRLDEKFDNVMLCLPAGSHARDSEPTRTNWLAYAYISSSLSVYNGDKWCTSEVTQLHEIGHNWGLRHASEGSAVYGDTTGAMGSTIGAGDDVPFGNRMCFNGAHSWQLQWYTSYNREIDPLTTSFAGTLVGVDRVPNVSTDETVVLKLTNAVEDYYIIYNHAVGANDGTTEAKNRVTITTKTTALDARTFLVAKLAVGQSATFTDWAGSGESVTVTVTSITADASTGNAQISVQSTSAAVGSVPTSGPTSGPTSEPTSGPTSTPTSGLTSKSPTSQGDGTGVPGSKGDPHFKTWAGEHFEIHGQCDLILARDEAFADGLGLDVQIRTKLVRYWSYIKQVAIRIGEDILEVQGDADHSETRAMYWVNFEYQPEIKVIGNTFPVEMIHGTGRFRKHHITIDLSSKYPGVKIVISTYKEFIRVDFVNPSKECFGNVDGILGNFKTGKTLARDHDTVIDDFNELGNEWQVRPSDTMLFHDVSDPQFPKRCVLPEDPQGKLRRRRLAESSVSVEDAQKACAKLTDELDRTECIYDVIATQDLDMAGAY